MKKNISCGRNLAEIFSSLLIAEELKCPNIFFNRCIYLRHETCVQNFTVLLAVRQVYFLNNTKY